MGELKIKLEEAEKKLNDVKVIIDDEMKNFEVFI